MVTAGSSLLLISEAEPGYAGRRSVNAPLPLLRASRLGNATPDGEAP